MAIPDKTAVVANMAGVERTSALVVFLRPWGLWPGHAFVRPIEAALTH